MIHQRIPYTTIGSGGVHETFAKHLVLKTLIIKVKRHAIGLPTIPIISQDKRFKCFPSFVWLTQIGVTVKDVKMNYI